MTTDDLVTVTEAATMLGVSRRTVIRRIAAGQIPARKLGAATSSYVLTRRDVQVAVSDAENHNSARGRAATASPP